MDLISILANHIWLYMIATLAIGFIFGRVVSEWSCSKFLCPLFHRKKLPHRLICVRHGQSEGNVDPILYRDVPDNAMHLTALGKEQVRASGKCIKKIIKNETTVYSIYLSIA